MVGSVLTEKKQDIVGGQRATAMDSSEHGDRETSGEERGMNAIYTCWDDQGKCYQFRADTEDECRTLINLAKVCFKVNIVDLCGVDDGGEVRAGSEDEDDFPETEYLKAGEEFKQIPMRMTRGKPTICIDGLQKLMSGEAPPTNPRPEPAKIMLKEMPVEMPVEESVEETEEHVRPLLVIKVIEAKEESKDLVGLFG